jgi:hypothetical protein
MQPAYAKLQSWLDGLTPTGCPVIIANQNAPTPPRPFVVCRITSVTDIARDFSANVRDLNYVEPEPEPDEPEEPAPEPEEPEDPEPEPEPPPPEVWVLDVVRWVRMAVQVQVFARPGLIFEAEGIAQGILDHAYNDVRNTTILGRGMAFNLVLQSPQTVDGVIGAEFEPRVVMALGFSASREMVYDVGAIDHVIMTGQAGQQTVESEASA